MHHNELRNLQVEMIKEGISNIHARMLNMIKYNIESITSKLKGIVGHHYYQVHLEYQDKQGATIFTWDKICYVRRRSDILGRKIIMDQYNIYDCIDSRAMLCNGSVSLSITCYLGRW